MTDIKGVPAIPSPGMFIGQDGITPPGYSYLNELSIVLGEVRTLLSTVEGVTDANTQSIADILATPTLETNIGFADAQQGEAVDVQLGSTYYNFVTFKAFTPRSSSSRIAFRSRVKLFHEYDGTGSATGYTFAVFNGDDLVTAMDGEIIGLNETAMVEAYAIITGQSGEQIYNLRIIRGGGDVTPEILSDPLPFATVTEFLE